MPSSKIWQNKRHKNIVFRMAKETTLTRFSLKNLFSLNFSKSEQKYITLKPWNLIKWITNNTQRMQLSFCFDLHYIQQCSRLTSGFDNFWVVLDDQTGCWGLNSGWRCVRQAPCLMHCLSGSFPFALMYKSAVLITTFRLFQKVLRTLKTIEFLLLFSFLFYYINIFYFVHSSISGT